MLLGLLGGGGLKWILVGLAALAIVATVGGVIYAYKSHVDGLNETITQQQEQIAGLEIDNQALRVSNESLEMEISRRVNESEQIRQELTRLREIDAISRDRLAQVERQLRDFERQDRIQGIRESRRAGLLLRMINRDVECYVENFENFDGECISGRFVPTGERFDQQPVE